MDAKNRDDERKLRQSPSPENIAREIRNQIKNGKISGQRQRIIEFFTPSEVQQMLEIQSGDPIIDLQSSQRWAEELFEITSSDTNLMTRCLLSLAKQTLPLVDAIDQEFITSGNRHTPFQDDDRMDHATKAIHFLEEHLLDELSEEEGQQLQRLTRWVSSVAYSYPGRMPRFGPESSRNTAARSIQSAMEIFSRLKSGHNPGQVRQQFVALIEEVVQSHARVYQFKHRLPTEMAVIPSEEYDKVRRILRSQMILWLLGIEEASSTQGQDRSREQIDEENLQESMRTESHGVRAAIVRLFRRLMGRQNP